MEIEVYKNFLTLVECGTYTKAAARINLVYSALMAQMKHLEADLGQKLIATHKGARKLELTDAGKIFWEQAKLIVQDDENMRQEMANFQSGYSGTLRIGSSWARTEELVTEYLAPFSEMHPRIDYEIVGTTLNSIEENLVNGLTEIAFTNSPLSLPQNMEILQTAKEQFYAVFLKEKALLEPTRSTITLPELVGKRLCISKGNSSLFLNVAAQAGCKLHIYATHNLRHTTLIWAKTGLGIGIIPMAADAPRLPELCYLHIEDDRLFTEKLMLKLQGKKLSPISQLFLDFCTGRR